MMNAEVPSFEDGSETLTPRRLPGVEQLIAAASRDPVQPETFAEQYLSQVRMFDYGSNGASLTGGDAEFAGSVLHNLITEGVDELYETYSQYSDMPENEFKHRVVYFGRVHDRRTDWWMPERERYAKGLVEELRENLYGFIALSRLVHRRSGGAVPSVRELSGEQQQQTFQQFYEEWNTYERLAAETGYYPNRWRRPLIYNSIADLRQELAITEPPLKPAQVISYFTHAGRGFHGRCAKMRENIIKKELAEKEPPRPKETVLLPRRPSKREGELNYKISRLLEEAPEYRRFAAERTPMEPLFVDTLEQIDEAIQTTCGYFVRDLAERYGEAINNVWGTGVSKQISELVKPKNFWGRLTNTRLLHLPLSPEFIEAYEKKFYQDTERQILDRIGVFTDMYSTGRGKIGESFQDVIIQVRNPEDPEHRQVDVSVRKNTSGAKIIEYLNMEVSSRAILEEVRNLRRPLSGGLPSLGHR
jgi:hypothetical protein